MNNEPVLNSDCIYKLIETVLYAIISGFGAYLGNGLALTRLFARLLGFEERPVSCPKPVLSRGKGSGDYWTISWLCQPSSIEFERTLIKCLHDVRLGLCACLDDVALFHWIAQNQDYWLSTRDRGRASFELLCTPDSVIIIVRDCCWGNPELINSLIRLYMSTCTTWVLVSVIDIVNSLKCSKLLSSLCPVDQG